VSKVLIGQYLNNLQDLRKISGSTRESVLREAFKDLLKGWARSHDLIFVPEYEITTPAKDRRYVDGALLHPLRMPFGYWEAKDENDDLDAEIEYKLRRGYPQDNIIFEDSTQAVLIQSKREVMRCGVDDVSALEKLLNLFFSFERAEVIEFRKGVEQFKTDLPNVLDALRSMIKQAYGENSQFLRAAKIFLAHAKEAINPSLTEADVREMLIQHILTEEIFSKVFGEDDFHRQNNVAKELYDLESQFFTGDLKKSTLRGLAPYYSAIRAAAVQISSHHEKQTFLKVIYENFYKVYNPKAADRLGVVYTPNEIVRFMVESADWLCEKHFKKNLINRDVEILDPAAGTGTFVCEMLEHFRGQPEMLKHKYLEELHVNEVAILPYYVANLNIEATYAAITGEYVEFPNLCFVDTLDNVQALSRAKYQTDTMSFGGVSEENVARIKRQNSRKISVIIGNPPYNANQLNENENNKNRTYPEIDKRIKNTYIAESTAQKTKLYDMYARFFRWASDRVDENGIVAFITNRSFINGRTFDGFRKVITQEFSEIYVIDLGGDVRENPKLSGTKHNVFGIQTGVAINVMVKRQPTQGCRIYYTRRPEFETAEEKISFLGCAKLGMLNFEEIRPDSKNNWINLVQNDFDTLLPIATKETKATKKPQLERAILKTFMIGVSTNRDDWVFDQNVSKLSEKLTFLISEFNNESTSLPQTLKSFSDLDNQQLRSTVKWSESLKRRLVNREIFSFQKDAIVKFLYRPFCKQHYYSAKEFSDRLTSNHYEIFGSGLNTKAKVIAFSGPNASKPFCILASNLVFGLDCIEKTQSVPISVLDQNGLAVDNITDWALDQFKNHYQPSRSKPQKPITKEAIFHYAYGVLHDPVYRKKYALNLKREFPRIPFYADFWQWADWGKELMEWHIAYENVEPYRLKRSDAADDGHPPKVLLKADKADGRILLDSRTTLSGVPPEAWDYKLGNRSALEWILDQHKEKKPKDPTIREKFNTYRFADYKEKVIDLLMRVTTVSVRTVAITQAMKKTSR